MVDDELRRVSVAVVVDTAIVSDDRRTVYMEHNSARTGTCNSYLPIVTNF